MFLKKWIYIYIKTNGRGDSKKKKKKKVFWKWIGVLIRPCLLFYLFCIFFLIWPSKLDHTYGAKKAFFLVGEFCRAKDSEILSLRGAKEFLNKLRVYKYYDPLAFGILNMKRTRLEISHLKNSLDSEHI
jgi:hypothetical protein